MRIQPCPGEMPFSVLAVAIEIRRMGRPLITIGDEVSNRRARARRTLDISSMKAPFLVLALAIGAQAQSLGEEPAETPPLPNELFRQAQQSLDEKEFVEAAKQFSQFIVSHPAHDRAPKALEKLATAHQSSGNKSRDSLIVSLKAMTRQGEGTPSFKTAMGWIKDHGGLMEWTFGRVPKDIRASATRGIQVKLGNVVWRRPFLPTYRLFRIPPPTD